MLIDELFNKISMQGKRIHRRGIKIFMIVKYKFLIRQILMSYASLKGNSSFYHTLAVHYPDNSTTNKGMSPLSCVNII